MLNKIEPEDCKLTHSRSCKNINEISERKTSKIGILNEKSKEDRVKRWHSHFKQLLYQKPKVENEENL